MSPEGSKRRPWWAVALMGGFGAVVGVSYLLGSPAHGEQQHVTASTFAPATDPERLTRIETRLNDIERSLGRIEGRLERK